MRWTIVSIIAVLVLGGDALAQTATVTRLRGTIAAMDGGALTIATRDGGHVTVTLKDDAKISALQASSLAAIGPGSFIGTAAVPGRDGGLTALEVVVFPENMRGTGEGHYDWDLQPGSSMTNANVDAVVTAKSGQELQLSYKGGTTKVTVAPDVPVVTFVPAERGDLRVGLAVYTPATAASDGRLTTSRVVVERDGVKPPM